MNVDMPTEEQEQQNQGTRILAQLDSPKGALRFNGMATNQEAAVELDESQTTMLDHPQEGVVDVVTGWIE
jgi:hypothetical protein